MRRTTSSIGLAAMALAKSAGLEITATTRNPEKFDELVAAGATHVVVDNGFIGESIRSIYPEGIDRVLELVGTTTLLDSLQATSRGGIVCMTGILGGQWTLAEFHPMDDVPTGVKLTSYSGEASDISVDQLQHYVSLVETGELRLKTGPREDRQPTSALDPDPGGTGLRVPHEGAQEQQGSMAQGAHRPSRATTRCRGAGQQECTNGLGTGDPGNGISTSTNAGGGFLRSPADRNHDQV
jgi:hypothetical protein